MTRKPPIVQGIEKILNRLSQLCILFCGVLLVVLVVTFGWLVFGRYVLNATPTWVEQLALLLVCYIAFIGAAAGIHEDGHLGVTLFRDMMPRPIQRVLLIVTDVMLTVFGAVMFVAGLELFAFGWATLLPMLNIPESIRTASVVGLGGLLTIFAGARVLLRSYFALRGEDYSRTPLTSEEGA